MTWIGEATSGSIPLINQNSSVGVVEPGTDGQWLSTVNSVPFWRSLNTVYASGATRITLNGTGKALVSGTITPSSTSTRIVAIATFTSLKDTGTAARQVSGHLRIGEFESSNSVGTSIPQQAVGAANAAIAPVIIHNMRTPGVTTPQHYILWGYSTLAGTPIANGYSLFLMEI